MPEPVSAFIIHPSLGQNNNCQGFAVAFVTCRKSTDFLSSLGFNCRWNQLCAVEMCCLKPFTGASQKIKRCVKFMGLDKKSQPILWRILGGP